MAGDISPRTEAFHNTCMATCAGHALQQLRLIGPALELLATEINNDTKPSHEKVSQWGAVANWLVTLVDRECEDLRNEDARDPEQHS